MLSVQRKIRAGKKMSRTNFIQKELYQMLDCGIKIKEHHTGLVEILQERTDINNVLKVLHALMGGPCRFNKLYDMTAIRHKRSFIHYVSFCVRFGLVRKSDGRYACYAISENGMLLYRIFSKPKSIHDQKQ